MNKHYRHTWATINLDHLWHNYEYLSLLSKKTLIPVIKADAYGHGSKEIFKFLYDKGIRFFSVSLIEEALELLPIHSDVDILIMGAISKEHFDIVSKNNLIFTLYDVDIFNELMTYQNPIRFHLKIDTGMHRYGLDDHLCIYQMMQEIKTKPNLSLEGIYSHLATADDDEVFLRKQIDCFYSVLESAPYLPKMIHLSNSSSIFKYESSLDKTTHARLGISLYGLSLDDPYPDIKPVMSLYTRVIQIKHLKKGDGLGYSQTYHAEQDETIALLPIGYADGWIRKNKHYDVIIDHKRYKLIGNICMDTCFVKVDEHIKKYDLVTLIGEALHMDEVAKRLETINYEVATNITKRVPRIYIKDGKIYD